jgi:hypothetical protein
MRDRRRTWVSLIALALGCGGKLEAAPGDGGNGSHAGSLVTASPSGSSGGNGGPGGPVASSASSSSSSSSSSGGISSGPPECSDFLDSGADLGCTGGDCTGGLICCGCFAYSGGLSVASICAPSPCAAGTYQLCASDPECVTGECQALPVVSTPKVCGPAADAGDASTVDGGDGGAILDASGPDAARVCHAPASGSCPAADVPCFEAACGGSCECNQGTWDCEANPCPPPL